MVNFKSKNARTPLPFAGLAALLLFSIGAPAAHAFETMNLKSDAGRVGVMVFSYNDNWGSYLGEWLYDKYMRMFLGRRYSKIYISRATSRGLSAEDIQAAFRTAMKSGSEIDFMTSTHSDSSTIRLTSELSVRPEDLLSPVLAEDETARDRLSFAGNFGCHSEAQSGQFANLGFRSYVGHSGISAGALAMREYLRQWVKKCGSVREAAVATNDRLDRLFSHKLPLWIYKKLSGQSEYTAVLQSFGDDQEFCDE